ncbi:hypothetical protein EUTSA_v10009518mg [Eutrema salsugineum]|uniref:Uncharacterized protein n=1 Tax=Eutrema salsugineum TaxID=72664 RepID=V4KZF1_EUTSA|nr:hypothetical protein EUTSA_v10009518mg [Eutrema salsugineum]
MVMHILLIAFSVATFVYVRHHKIPIAADIEVLGMFYGITGIGGIISWFSFFKHTPEMHYRGGTMDRISHILGFSFLIVLFYSISPAFALGFCIPSSLWFLFVLMYTIVYLTWRE